MKLLSKQRIVPVLGINRGRSSPRALELTPFVCRIAYEVPVEHGHRTEAESLDGFQPFSSEVEGITGITEKDVTAEEVSIAVTRFLEEQCGMFERREVIGGVVSEENLLRLNFFEQVYVPRFE